MKRNDKSNVLIITGVDPTRAYSCVKYLHLLLKKNNFNVDTWCCTPKDTVSAFEKWNGNIHSFRNTKMGSIPKIRSLYTTIFGLIIGIKYRNNIIICHDLYHYASCAIVKKLFPKTIFIHYCTEIYGEKNKFIHRFQNWLYSKMPNVPDLIIECDDLRLKYRKEKLKIRKNQVTILNTIPKEEIYEYIQKNKEIHDNPIITYSGRVGSIDDIKIFIDALSGVGEQYQLKLYCYGSENTLDELESYCNIKIPDKYVLYRNNTRENTLKQVSMADIGFVYYDPTYSINTLYAAPTKFFEYIGLGLPVISSGNESLKKIIKDYMIGFVMEKNDENGLRECIIKALKDPINLRMMANNCRNSFENFLCYEEQCKGALDSILELAKARN